LFAPEWPRPEVSLQGLLLQLNFFAFQLGLPMFGLFPLNDFFHRFQFSPRVTVIFQRQTQVLFRSFQGVIGSMSFVFTLFHHAVHGEQNSARQTTRQITRGSVVDRVQPSEHFIPIIFSGRAFRIPRCRSGAAHIFLLRPQMADSFVSRNETLHLNDQCPNPNDQ